MPWKRNLFAVQVGRLFIWVPTYSANKNLSVLSVVNSFSIVNTRLLVYLSSTVKDVNHGSGGVGLSQLLGRARPLNLEAVGQTNLSMIINNYWKCKFPMNPHVHLLVDLLLCRFFGPSVCPNLLTRREVTTPPDVQNKYYSITLMENSFLCAFPTSFSGTY